MGTRGDLESIVDDVRGSLGPRGDQFSASTRPGRAKEIEKDTQSRDGAENRVPDGIPEGITVTPDLHFDSKVM